MALKVLKTEAISTRYHTLMVFSAILFLQEYRYILSLRSDGEKQGLKLNLNAKTFPRRLCTGLPGKSDWIDLRNTWRGELIIRIGKELGSILCKLKMM